MVLWVGSAGMSGSVWADDDANVNDVALPMDDPAAIELGKTKYGKCSGFCHGSGGKGARGPCIVCSSYKRGGKNSDLIRNIEEGVKGRSIAGLPENLLGEVAKLGGGSLSLRIHLNQPPAIDEAIGKIRDTKTPSAERIALIDNFRTAVVAKAVPALLEIVQRENIEGGVTFAGWVKHEEFEAKRQDRAREREKAAAAAAAGTG